uniref:Mothers against decapentaplegic homolog n=1 Tax=Rhabditophanes sp. KR3021 TaxID=114890 RepID=A0AC35TJ98_9BILA
MQGFDSEDLDVLKKAVESNGIDIKQCAPGPPMETLEIELPGSSKVVTNDGEDEVMFDAKYDDSGLIPQIDKPMSMPYLCCKMWRWRALNVDAALHRLELMPWCRFGRVTINNATVSCCNPYHYGLWIRPEVSLNNEEDDDMAGTLYSKGPNQGQFSSETDYTGASNASDKYSTPKHHSKQHIEVAPRPGSIMSQPSLPNGRASEDVGSQAPHYINEGAESGSYRSPGSMNTTRHPSTSFPKYNPMSTEDADEEYLNNPPPPPGVQISPAPSLLLQHHQFNSKSTHQQHVGSAHSQALAWGRLARWEKKERIGEVIALYGEFVAVGRLAGTVFDSQDIQTDWDVDNEVSFSLIKKSDNDNFEDIWLYNSGSRPLFLSISSASSNQKADTIRRLCNGYCIRVHRIMLCPDTGKIVSGSDPANTMSFLTISVGVGWGINYQKVYLTELPCRYEVIFS